MMVVVVVAVEVVVIVLVVLEAVGEAVLCFRNVPHVRFLPTNYNATFC